MGGANTALYKALHDRFTLDIIASGGVTTLEDVKALGETGAAGVIIGRALYDGAIDLAEAIEAAT